VRVCFVYCGGSSYLMKSVDNVGLEILQSNAMRYFDKVNPASFALGTS
jgi:hypothetical protein